VSASAWRRAETDLSADGEVEEVLSIHTGQNVDQLRGNTDRDQVFRAHEAITYGLADAVITAVLEPTPPVPVLTR
jgi:ATP-dependent Clp protease, protease subunit